MRLAELVKDKTIRTVEDHGWRVVIWFTDGTNLVVTAVTDSGDQRERPYLRLQVQR